MQEARRLAYLNAMQVDSWLPRLALPFAAPSPLQWQTPVEAELPEPVMQVPRPVAAAPAPTPEPVAAPVEALRSRIEVPRPATPARGTPPAVVEDVEAEAEAAPTTAAGAPPRFALQLLRAGACVLLVELPTGEPFASRDPAYLLLKDLLRAAGLPDSPQVLGEPVRWPLLRRGSLDQGPQAALEYVQGFIAARLEAEGDCRCLWLVGLSAVRFAGEGEAELFNRELQIDGLGAAWAVPGLDLLMDEPARKADLWRAMRRVMQRWQRVDATNE